MSQDDQIDGLVEDLGSAAAMAEELGLNMVNQLIRMALLELAERLRYSSTILPPKVSSVRRDRARLSAAGRRVRAASARRRVGSSSKE